MADQLERKGDLATIACLFFATSLPNITLKSFLATYADRLQVLFMLIPCLCRG